VLSSVMAGLPQGADLIGQGDQVERFVYDAGGAHTVVFRQQGGIVFGGQENDGYSGNPGVRLQLRQDGGAVHIAHHDIKDDHLRVAVEHGFDGVDAVFAQADADAAHIFQSGLDQHAHVRFVVDVNHVI